METIFGHDIGTSECVLSEDWIQNPVEFKYLSGDESMLSKCVDLGVKAKRENWLWTKWYFKIQGQPAIIILDWERDVYTLSGFGFGEREQGRDTHCTGERMNNLYKSLEVVED